MMEVSGEVNSSVWVFKKRICPQQMHHEAEQHQTRSPAIAGEWVFIEQQGGGHHADTGNQWRGNLGHRIAHQQPPHRP
jgi:hypothetical protein